jgi:hypothetical protein
MKHRIFLMGAAHGFHDGGDAVQAEVDTAYLISAA